MPVRGGRESAPVPEVGTVRGGWTGRARQRDLPEGVEAGHQNEGASL
jgi:hypothetical protein